MLLQLLLYQKVPAKSVIKQNTSTTDYKREREIERKRMQLMNEIDSDSRELPTFRLRTVSAKNNDDEGSGGRGSKNEKSSTRIVRHLEAFRQRR